MARPKSALEDPLQLKMVLLDAENLQYKLLTYGHHRSIGRNYPRKQGRILKDVYKEI